MIFSCFFFLNVLWVWYCIRLVCLLGKFFIPLISRLTSSFVISRKILIDWILNTSFPGPREHQAALHTAAATAAVRHRCGGRALQDGRLRGLFHMLSAGGGERGGGA